MEDIIILILQIEINKVRTLHPIFSSLSAPSITSVGCQIAYILEHLNLEHLLFCLICIIYRTTPRTEDFNVLMMLID